MATATASKTENPSDTADLSSMPPAAEDASSPLPPPASTGGDGAKPATVVAGDKDADGGELVTDIQRKMKRAARFGMPVHLSEEEKRNSRAERFGTGSSGELDSSKQSEELKKKARSERFGIVQSAPTDEEAKKKARLARFGSSPVPDAAEEAKKKARALRFSQLDSGSKKANGKGGIEVETAITSKAGGGT